MAGPEKHCYPDSLPPDEIQPCTKCGKVTLCKCYHFTEWYCPACIAKMTAEHQQQARDYQRVVEEREHQFREEKKNNKPHPLETLFLVPWGCGSLLLGLLTISYTLALLKREIPGKGFLGFLLFLAGWFFFWHLAFKALDAFLGKGEN